MHHRSDHGARSDRQTAHGAVVDAGGVDGLVQRLTHALVLERVLAGRACAGQLIAELVQTQIDGAVFRAFDDLDVGAGLHAGQVLRRWIDHEIDLTRDQRGRAGGGGLDGGEHHFIDVALRRVPPVRILLQDQLHVRLPAHELEGAGAVGIARGEVFFLACVVLRFDGVVLLGPCLVHDARLGQVAQQRGVGALEDQIDGEVVDLLDFLNARHRGDHVRWLGARAGQREHHVVGGERRTIMEFHALAQLEAHLCGGSLRPFGGQSRNGLVLVVVAHQTFVDLLHVGMRGLVVLRHRIGGENVVGTGRSQRDGTGRAADGRQQRCRKNSPLETRSSIHIPDS